MILNPASTRSILVIKLRAAGDVVLSTIVLPNIRAAFPDARLHVLTEKPHEPLVRGHPAVDDVVVYDRHTMSGLDLIRAVRRRRYDTVFDLFGNPRTALLTRLSGATARIGYRFRGRSYAYTVVVPPRGGEVHNTQFNLDALEAVGIPILHRSISVPIAPDDDSFVGNFLPPQFAQATLRVAFNTGGGWYTKRWSGENFARLADRVADEFGAFILLTWGPGEEGDVRAIAGMMRHTPYVPPATTFPQLASLLRRCSVVVSNDTGPMHVATAVGTPVLAIYGPTNPRLQGPFGDIHEVVTMSGLSCLGCNLTSCPIGHPCMKDLTVDRVMDRFRVLLAKNALRA